MTFKVSVAQIIQSDRRGETEQALNVLKNLVLNERLMLEQTLRGAVKLHQWHGFKVKLQ